jgi:hypothetical protein
MHDSVTLIFDCFGGTICGGSNGTLTLATSNYLYAEMIYCNVQSLLCVFVLGFRCGVGFFMGRFLPHAVPKGTDSRRQAARYHNEVWYISTPLP